MLLANVAPVWRDPQMPPHVLHEEAHVPELGVTHAALETWELVLRLGDVDVLKHFVLLLEQNVVYWTSDLAIMDQGVGLHVFPSLEFHVTLWAVDPRWASSALFHMSLDRGPILL